LGTLFLLLPLPFEPFVEVMIRPRSYRKN
jgi:hypothetical protein